MPLRRITANVCELRSRRACGPPEDRTAFVGEKERSFETEGTELTWPDGGGQN